MIIWYHGTIKEYYKKILKEGFKKGTYFTPYFDSALQMGGEFIFGVLFEESPSKYWEWISDKRISKNNIISLRKIGLELLYYNPKLYKKIKISQQKEEYGEEIIFCKKCNGHGETSYPEDGHHLLPRGSSFCNERKIIVCKKCGGFGCYYPNGKKINDT
jgi:hypothetical protein